MAELNDLKVNGDLEITGTLTAQNAVVTGLDGLTATVSELNFMDGVTSNVQTQLNGKAASSHTHSNYADSDHTHNYAASSHGNHVPTPQTASNKVFLRNDNTWATVTPANIGAAASSHGNHVPTPQTANNKVFLRNDNTWQTITPANIGAAASSHGNHVPTKQTASNKVFLRNDNTWQTITLSNLGAKFTQIVANGSAATSASWTNNAFDFLIGCVRPASSNTPTCFSIATAHCSELQITDEVQCTVWNTTGTGMTRKSGSGTIFGLWGVNVV